MIKVDLANLSAEDLQKIIIDQCSTYGVVERISVVRNDVRYAVASISMRDPTESQAVKRVFGDLLVDNTVLIRLEQQ